MLSQRGGGRASVDKGLSLHWTGFAIFRISIFWNNGGREEKSFFFFIHQKLSFFKN